PRAGEPATAAAEGILGLLDPAEFLVVGAVVCAGVGAASLFKHLQLARGGRVVAEMLGGRRLAPDSREPAERRLLNVVEEMGIAAGVPVPPVYVLPEEGINAFAAGHGTGDAVIGVTEGGMRRLSRDQLQGVVAHEYSHVLNGDMRLNLRLIAALNGILFIAQAGRVLLRAGRSRGTRRGRGDASAVVLVLGLALLLIGLVGLLFARLIKAGVSREREYLADASAVQFTRNPEGLAGALRQIGGLAAHGRVLDLQAETASHLFLVHALGGSGGGWFATHPPLGERIRRLDPAWNGELPVLPAEPEPIAPEEEFAVSMLSAQAAPMAVRDVSPPPAPGLAEAPVPAELLAGCRDPELAQALVLNALIAAPLPTVRQQELLQQSCAALPEPLRAALSRAGPLRVVALAMPALKHLDAPARTGLIASATRLAELDERLDLRELAIAVLLAHHLGEQSRHRGARHPRIGSASRPLAVLLAAL
ncbi:MAG: M48 family metalloprotease, partial [Gammaproteobacteria bacterium]